MEYFYVMISPFFYNLYFQSEHYFRY